jgi:hypothetical protein
MPGRGNSQTGFDIIIKITDCDTGHITCSKCCGTDFIVIIDFIDGNLLPSSQERQGEPLSLGLDVS